MSDPLEFRADVDDGDIERGEFCYQPKDGPPKWLHFWPRDCDCPLSAAIAPQRNDVGASWQLTGPRDRPTLSPSVDAKGHWHGFLTAGVARSVD